MAILLVYGAAFLPLMYYWITKWLMEGQDLEKGIEGEADIFERLPEAARLFALENVAILGGTLGPAVLATVLIRRLGWAKGLAATAAIVALMLSRVGIGPALCKRLLGVETLSDVPVEDLVRKALEEEKAAVPATA